MGFGLVIEFIERLQIVTASNYNAIANSHTLQFTTTPRCKLDTVGYSTTLQQYNIRKKEQTNLQHERIWDNRCKIHQKQQFPPP
jgi:hypothetical protein